MLACGSCGRNRRKQGERARFERNFQIGKTFKYYFQCRRADILGVLTGIPVLARNPDDQGRGALKQLHFADLNCGLGICVVSDVTGDFCCMRLEGGIECLDGLEV
jgi:hypothetical protein